MNEPLLNAVRPLYSPADLHPAFQLRYGWNAWPSGMFFPTLPDGASWDELQTQWESDGLRVLETTCSKELIGLGGRRALSDCR